MEDILPRIIPADPKIRLSASAKQQSEGERSYSLNEAVGALLHLALQTRPDLAFAVCQVAKFGRNPQSEHWKALDQILTTVLKSHERLWNLDWWQEKGTYWFFRCGLCR